jgi:hypothetical protein
METGKSWIELPSCGVCDLGQEKVKSEIFGLSYLE